MTGAQRVETILINLRRTAAPLGMAAALIATAACSSNAPARSAAPATAAATASARQSSGEGPAAGGGSPAVKVTHSEISSDGASGSTPAEPVPDDLREEALEPAVAAGDEPLPEVGDPPSAEPSDPRDDLQEALRAYESADVFWQQGDFDDAFAALDRAYELMVGAAVDPDDPVLAQEKETLRQLISRRVVEIYASRRTAVGDMDGAIPVEINDQVRREITSFQGPERASFLEAYRRSGLYRPMMVEVLREEGLPEQLSWLPMVESWYKVRALSTARALGMWQFISSTGYRYGLERTWWVDERMDPEKSTRAAAAYLTDLHELFGDWLTALAGYNSGESRVLREIKRQREGYFDRFWDLYQRLPRETRRYVPRFIATLAIVEDPEKYGFTDLPEPLPALAFETVEVRRAAGLAALDGALGLERGTLAALNPELRQKAVPDEPYPLRVPPGAGGMVQAKIAALPEWEAPSGTGVHRVRRGETLSAIAQRYGTSVRNLMALNRLRTAHRIWPGQQLQVPGGGGPQGLPPGAETVHVVRRGDSLWRLASRYGTTVSRIQADNALRRTLLRPGQRLTIRAGRGGGGVSAGGGSGTYVVRRGDTLGKIARSHRVSLTRLLRANRLSKRSTIYPGQRLVIP